jgi:hypothetical protein
MPTPTESFCDLTNAASESLLASGNGYLRYVATAQQEWLRLGMSLFQRQMETGRRVMGSWNMMDAVAAYSELMKDTVEEFVTAAGRLVEGASSIGSQAAQNSEQAFRTSAKAVTETAQAAQNQAVEIAERMAKPEESIYAAIGDALRARRQKRE